jgi:WASH complex subunit strumpellin
MLVREYLSETRILLTKMIRYVNIKEEIQETIAIISDISYAWEIINDYVSLMQVRIKKYPFF